MAEKDIEPGTMPSIETQPKPVVRNPIANDAAPTDSHILARADHGEKGLIQQSGVKEETTDVGWTQSHQEIREPLVAGLSNEDLWLLVRRFNKQIYYVKAVSDAPLQKLDLNRAEDEEFSPDKLRATIERFYTTVVVGLTCAVKHIARLRSWREPRRTAAFCSVYFTAWLLDLVVPMLLGVLVALVVEPRCREVLFPPAPIALVSSSTGGVQKPKAGVLGSHDSITGAPERLKGEAAEQEASNFVASVASVAVGSAAGKHDQASPTEETVEKDVPDPMEIVSRTADAQTAAKGDVPADTHDKTRQPMKQAVMENANLAMRVMSDITDTYERFANALSPTPPFHVLEPRLRLAGVLTGGCLVSLFMSSYMLIKVSGFFLGIGFFGDPLLWRVATYLNREYPHWEKLLELQNSLLKGVPTNAQLTVTLLRIGEANTAPLPPPPPVGLEKPPSRPASINHEELSTTLDVPESEIEQAASAEPAFEPGGTHGETTQSSPPKKTWMSSIMNVFRGTTAAGVRSKLAVDHVKAAAGSKAARNRIGILRRKGGVSLPVGPIEFNARYQGKRGAAVIDSSKEQPLLYFTTDSTADSNTDNAIEERKKGSILFSMPVTDIREMRKLGGMGWKGKLVVGWAVGSSKEVVDGLLLRGRLPHQVFQLTAMRTRDELFNRLVAIDGQVWESC
ncbi:hypothetical protein ASPZODRAFT_135098 [Penicilliopsis zonata CBS 506.65]|uniref:Uncharacterized protein n=1 Tax=Penicilliopsis zonata CBS 506.65 TaxID=1073090 RepID=A0A1L9SAT0_9EURO|nr:hypothetical protein ASPZODRAFT_135098 [Penicilliopsis zonata CBS 506.65]OJJ44292.1 hypothetical protein ASPZODRAFT_135098 [Penicilliopsis zonata CBS 506.65]